MRIIIRGISLDNLELWKDKFSFTEYTDPYFSKDKSFLFLTVNCREKGLEFIQKFHNIKWKGDVLRVSESIFDPYTPRIPTIINTEEYKDTFTEIPEFKTEIIERKDGKYRIRNPKSRKIMQVLKENSKLKKRFRDNFIQESSVRDLTWNLIQEDFQVSSSEEEENPVNLRGLFTEITDFKFDLVVKEPQVIQEPEEEIIKSFSGSSQMFFVFEKVGIFKRNQAYKELTLQERKELTRIYKQRHKDASRRKTETQVGRAFKKMLEARLTKASLLKKILDAVKDLITEANFDCSDAGIAMQSMDSSHVALVVLLLRQQGFEHYRCDRNMSIGMNIASLTKVVKIAGSDDSITLKAADKADVLNLLFESPNEDRMCEFELKLMDIDVERVGVPDGSYDAVIKIPSSEFTRIIRDLSALSETVTIDVIKEGIRFSAAGDSGKGSVALKPSSGSVDEETDKSVTIELNSPVSTTLSLKYLMNFTKASSLSDSVNISITEGLPVMVEYKAHDAGYLQFFLAPKLGEDEEE